MEFQYITVMYKHEFVLAVIKTLHITNFNDVIFAIKANRKLTECFFIQLFEHRVHLTLGKEFEYELFSFCT